MPAPAGSEALGGTTRFSITDRFSSSPMTRKPVNRSMCQQQPRHRLVRRFRSAPHRLLLDFTATVPPTTPGKAINSEASCPVDTLKNGRAKIGNPEEPALKLSERWPRKK